jgi:hypothetical protein
VNQKKCRSRLYGIEIDRMGPTETDAGMFIELYHHAASAFSRHAVGLKNGAL